MKLRFKPLEEADFPLLLKWLQTPHVKAWWDPEIDWTTEKIAAHYRPYAQGYQYITQTDGTVIQKPIHAFVMISIDHRFQLIFHQGTRSHPPSDHGA